MLLRTILLAAFLAAPLAALPSSVSAQEKGLEKAAAVSAKGDVAPGVAKNAAAKRPMALPAGVAKVFGDGPLPPGMSRAFPGTEEAPAPTDDDGAAGDEDTTSGDDGGAGECVGGIMIGSNGIPMPC